MIGLKGNCSDQLRRFLEALFITHAETRLNTIGRLMEQQSDTPKKSKLGHVWCGNLVRHVRCS